MPPFPDGRQEKEACIIDSLINARINIIKLVIKIYARYLCRWFFVGSS